MTGSQTGKVAIVTGGSANLGQLFAESLASDGANVVVHYNSPRRADEAQGVVNDLKATGVEATAREQLRAAHQMLDEMGMTAFAERARRELRATGETARKRSDPADHGAVGSAALTTQEALVARLARDGLSNPEIGTRLFISPGTAKYHLSNVFTKLGISSRNQLDRVLPAD